MQAAKFFPKILNEKKVWNRVGNGLVGNLLPKKTHDNKLLIPATIHFDFGRGNHMPSPESWEIRPISKIWHPSCNTALHMGILSQSKLPEAKVLKTGFQTKEVGGGKIKALEKTARFFNNTLNTNN